MREVREFDTFRLDPSRRRLERIGGEQIALGAKAFDALVLLVEHAGEPVSRKALIDALWPDTVVEENNLTQAVSRLRRVLGQGYIVTLPGRGYQFIGALKAGTENTSPTDAAAKTVMPEPADPPMTPAAGDGSAGSTHERSPPDANSVAHAPLKRPADGLASGNDARYRRRTRRRIVGVAAIAVALLSAWSYVRFVPHEQALRLTVGAGTSGAAEPSIAVLPFVNVSSDADQAYFADGLSDELRNQLARLKGLNVAGRRSSFAFTGRNPNLRGIGKALNVATVLEGTVRKSGNRLRISAELVNVANGYDLWSGTYERELDDVFAIQNEIASAVVNALSPALGVKASAADYGGTKNFASYDHFLRGLTQEAQLDTKALRDAAAEFRRAVAIDPDYGQAWAELGIVLSQMAIAFPDQADALLREREHAAQRALNVAPELPSTENVEAWIAYDRRDWQTGTAICSKIFDETPDPRTRRVCSGGLTALGFVTEALPYREAAARADPLSMNASVTLERHYVLMGMGTAAAREYRRNARLQGGGWAREEPMLISLMQTGATPRQLADRLARTCTVADAPAFCFDLLDAARSPAQAPAKLSELLDRLRSNAPESAYLVALFAAYFKDRGVTLEALEAFAPSAPSALYQHLWYPLLRNARADPRFKDIVRSIGFAKMWRKTGRWNDHCRPVGANDFRCT